MVTTYYRSKLFRNENVDRNEYRNKEHKDTRIQGLGRKDRKDKEKEGRSKKRRDSKVTERE